MIDLVSRPDREQWADGVNPENINDLIQARIDRKISRRRMIEMATKLGIAAPVIPVMLFATSDRRAFAAPGQAGLTIQDRGQAQTIPNTGPYQAEGTPVEGGTLIVATTEEPDTLHPWLTVLVSTGNYLSAMCNTLLQYDSTQTLQPSLAEAFEVGEDGLTYTFQLRQGVTFHNGQPFTGQDVIDSWQMIINPEFAAIQPAGWNEITDIQHPDPTTLIMTTSEIYAPFMAVVAGGGSSSIICPSTEIAKGVDTFKQEFGRHPIGTGPFQFVEWKTKEQVTMERNPNYWGTPAKLERIVYRTLPDDNTVLVQLRTGEIHLSDGVGATRVDEVLGFDTTVVIENPGMSWSHLDLKNISFLRETPVRQALDFATPSQQIVDQLLKGYAVRSVADQAPGTWAHNPNIQPRPYDPEQAKALLDSVGLTVGDDDVRERDGVKFEIELWGIAGDTQQQQICQVIAQSWNEIGVKTSTHFQDTSTLWGPEGYQWNEKMTACLYSWFNGNDPNDSFLYWHTSQIPKTPTDSGYNSPAYFFPYNFAPELDPILEAAAKTTDQEERKQLYWQAQEILAREVPAIFISWSKGFTPNSRKLSGLWPSAFNYLLWNSETLFLVE